MISRICFLSLAFANLTFFVWAQGYFGPIDTNREPQRLQQQLHAEKLQIVMETGGGAEPKIAPSLKPEPELCRTVSGLSLVDAEALKSHLDAAGVKAKLQPVAESFIYLALIPNLAGKLLADKKAAELRQLGITEFSVNNLENDYYEIVLGRFHNEPSAHAFLAALNGRGIRSARIEARMPVAVFASLDITAAATALDLTAWLAPYAEAKVVACAAPERPAEANPT
ncbi:MAG TPA: hypothetical protein VJ001_14085 [Rhodocyclaceae bacterium]|nr:hypothetical protein [Rhodocyclaceae bacterium]